jgi:hypothetical protein
LSVRARSLLVCGAISFALHVAAFTTVGHRSTPLLPNRATTQPLSGETLDIQTPATPEGDLAQMAVTSARASEDGRAGEPLSSQPATDVGRSDRVVSAPRNLAPGSGDARHELFGAVGARFATDLSSTLTRAIPQAFSADPAWTNAAFGGAGIADVTLVLDEAGHLATSSVAGHPSSALRSSIERTLALLAERFFTARRATTRLRLSAHVTLDDLHDGLHGDVFALSGGSFAGTVGSAFFALPARTGAGRRIDVQVHELP